MNNYPHNYCHVTHQIDRYNELTTEEYFDTISDQFEPEDFELEIENIKQSWNIYHDHDFYNGDLHNDY
jgi:hypothetical protein